MQSLPTHAMDGGGQGGGGGKSPWLCVAAQCLSKGFAPGSTELWLGTEHQYLQQTAQPCRADTSGSLHQCTSSEKH